MIKYTFLLPAYKPNFLEEALVSIKEQTYKDFKVIVSDDCSPHDLKSIFEKTCGDDPRFVFRRNEKNMGGKSLVSHWNLLVDMCDTEYFILASDDDVYEPTFLEEVDKLAVKYPEVDLIRARVKLINEQGNLLAKDAIYEEKLSDIEFISQLYGNHYIKCIANFVFKAKKLQVINGFKDFPLAWNSDSAIVIETSRNGIANTHKLLFSFRNSTVNISYGRNDKERCFKKLMASFEYDNWFGNYLRQNKQDLDSMDIYYKYQMSIIEAMHEDAIKDELYTYISGVSFFNLLKIMHRTKSLYKNLNCFYLYLRGIV